MASLYEKIEEASTYIKNTTDTIPEIGIILGTGLGNLTEMVNVESVIDYKDIPNFPESTVETHEGKLVIGNLAEKNVAVMQGRFHYYEGYSLQDVTFPIRVLKALGVKNIIITNAAGGMNAKYKKGEIVLIEDQINITGQNPLIGVADDRLGPRFPDMSAPYDQKLMELAEAAAEDEDIVVKRGTYIWVTGPCLETKAEYAFMYNIGADIVGMSTVPEVIVANQVGLKVLGISCVTDLCIPESLQPACIEDIIKTAEAAGPKIDHLIKALIKRIN